MSALGPQTINSSYVGLLQVPGGVTSTLQNVQDGAGNPTGIQLSTTSVGINDLAFANASNISGGIAGNVPYQTSPNHTAFVAPGTAGQVFTSNGTGAPYWSTVSFSTVANIAGGISGSVPYQSATNTTAFVSPGTAGQIFTSNGNSAPYWSSVSLSSRVSNNGTIYSGSISRPISDMFGDYISVRDFGAVGDGVTDDTAAINAALNCGSKRIFLPSGSYRTTGTINVPANVIFYGTATANDANQFGFGIVADLNVSPIITVDGGGASLGATLDSIAVTRAAGAIPAGSVGVQVQSSDNCLLQSVSVTRCAIGFNIIYQLGINLIRCTTSTISEVHLATTAYEITCTACRFGRNGGFDLTPSYYVKISGGGDTFKFVGCQFNQSGGYVGSCFGASDYSSPNGIIIIDACHFELANAFFNVSGTTTLFDRLSVTNSTINLGYAAPMFTVPPASIRNFTLNGCGFVLATITLDQQGYWIIVNNGILCDVLLNAGNGICANNNFAANLTVQGNFSYQTVISNNTFDAAKNIYNSATGLISIFNNVIGDAAKNQLLDNNIFGNLGIGIQTPYNGYAPNTGNSISLKNGTSTLWTNTASTWNETTAGGAITYFSDNNLYIDAKDSTSNIFFRANGATKRVEISPAGVVKFNNYGAGALSTNASGVIAASDGRYKTKTRDVTDGLSKILSLKPTYYRWNEDSPFHTEYEELGFFAQEVAQVIPEASPDDEQDDKFKNYYDRAIIAMMTVAIQELNAEVQALKNK